MEYNDLEKLLSNFTNSQLEAVAGFALKIASAKMESWTGEIAYTVTINQGGVAGPIKCNRSEIIHANAKRKVRSRGI